MRQIRPVGPFGDAFGPWRLPGGALDPILGWRDPEKHKKHFEGPSFWSRFLTNVDTFVVMFFTCFLNLSPAIFFAPAATRRLQF